MTYFFEDKITRVSRCVNDRFIVQKQVGERDGWREKVPVYGDFLMDTLGRISSEYYDKISIFEDALEEVENGFFIAEKDGVKFLIDGNFNVIASDFQYISKFSENGLALIQFKKGERYFWINRNGEILGAEYENVGQFSFGFAPIKIDGKWFFVDEKFEVKSEGFEGLADTSSSKYFMARNGEDYFVLDREFKIVSKPLPSFLDVSDYGLVYKIKAEKGELFQVLDFDGNELFTASSINRCNDRIFMLQKNGRTYFFNQETRKLVGREEGFVRSDGFDGSIAPVCLGYDERDEGIYTFLKEDGSLMTPRYEMTRMVKKDRGVAYLPNAVGERGKYYFTDENGNAYGKGYSRLGRFNDGLAYFECKKDRYTFVSEDGKRFSRDYDDVGNFSNGFGVVREGKSYDVVDTHENYMSEISDFAKRIENDPLQFLNIPEKFYGDTPLVERLYSFAKAVLEGRWSDNLSEEEKQKLLHAANSIYDKYEEAKVKISKRKN